VTTKHPSPETLTYEQARDELVQIVGKLEDGAASLDESMALWERGEALAQRCESLLNTAEKAIAAATEDNDDE